MKDKEGRAITPLVENAYRPLVVTAEAEDFFFEIGRASCRERV